MQLVNLTKTTIILLDKTLRTLDTLPSKGRAVLVNNTEYYLPHESLPGATVDVPVVGYGEVKVIHVSKGAPCTYDDFPAPVEGIAYLVEPEVAVVLGRADVYAPNYTAISFGYEANKITSIVRHCSRN